MKKIFIIFGVFSLVMFSPPVFSKCAKTEQEIITGGACSISELNASMLKQQNETNNTEMYSNKERNIKPIKMKKKTKQTECVWGPCLIKEIYK